MIYNKIKRNEIHIKCDLSEYNTIEYHRELRYALAQDIDKVVIEITMSVNNKEDSNGE